MKFKLFKFLVEEMGYTTFILEDNYGNCQYINDYILGGEENLDNELKKLTSIWNTMEFKNMINWMREYNLNNSQKEKIKFYGMDIQDPYYSGKSFLNYVELVDKEFYDSICEDVKKITGSKSGIVTALNVDDILMQMKGIKEKFEKNKEGYVKKSSEEKFQEALISISVVCENIEFQKSIIASPQDTSLRDKFMAENAKTIINNRMSHGKIMIWAHNEHLWCGGSNIKRAGEYLKEAYGDKYYIIGFQFYTGSFNAQYMDKQGNVNRVYNKQSEDKPIKNSLSEILKAATAKNYFIDFSKACEDKKINEIFSGTVPVNSIGGVYISDERYRYKYVIPKETFDGVIFITNSSPSNMLQG